MQTELKSICEPSTPDSIGVGSSPLLGSVLLSDDLALADEWSKTLDWRHLPHGGWRPVIGRLACEVKRLRGVCKSEYNQGTLAHAEAVRYLDYPNGDALCELVFALESGDPERITNAKASARKQADKHARLLRYA